MSRNKKLILYGTMLLAGLLVFILDVFFSKTGWHSWAGHLHSKCSDDTWKYDQALHIEPPIEKPFFNGT